MEQLMTEKVSRVLSVALRGNWQFGHQNTKAG